MSHIIIWFNNAGALPSYHTTVYTEVKNLKLKLTFHSVATLYTFYTFQQKSVVKNNINNVSFCLNRLFEDWLHCIKWQEQGQKRIK